jgi:hypothetical protein
MDITTMLGPGEIEIHRMMRNEIVVVTNQRILIFGNDGKSIERCFLRDVRSTYVMRLWGFLGPPIVMLRYADHAEGRISPGRISHEGQRNIICPTMEQANELEVKIREAILVSGN